MRNRLYVANLSETVTEEQLREIFVAQGEVNSIEFGTDEAFNTRFAIVEMAVEKNATKAMNELNGQKVEERALAISYPDADITRTLLPKQRKTIEAIAAELGETEKVPLRELETMVLLTSVSFAQAILKEALEVEEAGGIMTSDGQRRRSKGGVFFYLARPRLAQPVRHIVFGRKGKLPKPTELETETPENAEAASTS